MTVRPFDLKRLPHVSRVGNQAARAAAARLGNVAQRPIVLRIAPFGQVSLTCLDVTAPTTPDEGDAVWTLTRAGGDRRHAYVLLSGLSALRIVSVVLGIPAPRCWRALGAAERGVATATIAAIVRATSREFTVSLGPRPWLPESRARLVVSVDFGSFRERAQLDIPPEWIPPESGRSLFVSEAIRREVTVTLVVQVASTTLPAGDWARACPGDAVIFDDVAAFSRDQPWSVQLIVGEFSAGGVIKPGGELTILTLFEPGLAAAFSWTRGEPANERRTSVDKDESEKAAIAAFAAAPIQVIAEIGRLYLRADELIALAPGSVLELGPLRPNTIDLRVGESVWAQGELVDVDGHLGVRLTKVHPARAAPPSQDADTLR